MPHKWTPYTLTQIPGITVHDPKLSHFFFFFCFIIVQKSYLLGKCSKLSHFFEVFFCWKKCENLGLRTVFSNALRNTWKFLYCDLVRSSLLVAVGQVLLDRSLTRSSFCRNNFLYNNHKLDTKIQLQYRHLQYTESLTWFFVEKNNINNQYINLSFLSCHVVSFVYKEKRVKKIFRILNITVIENRIFWKYVCMLSRVRVNYPNS